MAKVIFEFNDIDEDEQHDISLCVNRHKLESSLYKIEDYVRSLKKYEEREFIPVEEVEQKLSVLLQDWYDLQE